MIVYNVKRRWFAEKYFAEKYRVELGLKPSATLKVEVDSRGGLVALLNALCDPPLPGQPLPMSALPATPELVDRASAPPKQLTGRDIPDCVPSFLLKSYGVER